MTSVLLLALLSACQDYDLDEKGAAPPFDTGAPPARTTTALRTRRGAETGVHARIGEAWGEVVCP